MAYSERKFQTDFKKWCLANFRGPAVFEFKVSKGSRIPFSALKDHQKQALEFASEGKGFFFKIPDAGYQNPFDGVMFHKIPAFVVIMFNTEKQRKKFYMITIRQWLDFVEKSEMRSVSEDDARSIGTVFSL